MGQDLVYPGRLPTPWICAHRSPLLSFERSGVRGGSTRRDGPSHGRGGRRCLRVIQGYVILRRGQMDVGAGVVARAAGHDCSGILGGNGDLHYGQILQPFPQHLQSALVEQAGSSTACNSNAC